MLTTMSLNETEQPPPDARPPLDSGEWVQYILDTCSTVDEVIATDDTVRIFTVDHYLVGDRNGRAVTIEFLDGQLVAHTGPELPVAALANNVYASSVPIWERLRASGFYAGLGSSLHRFCLAADRVAGFRPTSAAEAVAYAFETLDLVRGELFSPSPTNWSLVFDSENRRAYYRTSRNRAIRWIDLGAMDLRCGPPAGMIDIHDGGPGDLTGDLPDFDFEVNRHHFERFLEIWGVNIPHSTMMWVLHYIDDFGCVSPRRATARRVAPTP
jgi:choloylglycine hydrolase